MHLLFVYVFNQTKCELHECTHKNNSKFMLLCSISINGWL